MYYLVNGYRFMTPPKMIKWMLIKYVFTKTSKTQIFYGCITKLCKTQLQKTL